MLKMLFDVQKRLRVTVDDITVTFW